nr:hypothetical protein [Tanacetum cinerariifolium]
DKRLRDLMMMILMKQTEERDMMLYMVKTDMLMLVAEIKVGDKTADDVDKLTCLADVVKSRQEPSRSVPEDLTRSVPKEPSRSVLKELTRSVPKEPSRSVLKELTRSVPKEPSRSVLKEPTRSVPEEPSRSVPTEPTRSVPKEPSRSVLKDPI